MHTVKYLAVYNNVTGITVYMNLPKRKDTIPVLINIVWCRFCIVCWTCTKWGVQMGKVLQ